MADATLQDKLSQELLPELETVHHPTLYLQDGDIALSAKDAHGTLYIFRVDKVFLKRHSSIFADMFALPLSTGEKEEYDGIPTVHLSDDATELADMLQALYHGLPVLKRSDSELYFKVNGVMKLADKYHISFLRDLIVGHTEQDWPKTLADFVRLRKDMKVVMTPAKPTCTSLQRPRFPFMIEAFPEPASSIRLAVDYDIPSILPAAFYFLSTLDPQHNNWKRGQELCDSRGLSMSIFEWNARWYLLNDSEMLRYYRGKERLIKELMSIGNVFRIRHEHCDAKWSAEVVSEMDEELPPCAPVVNQIMLRQEMRHGLGLLDPKTFALHPDPIGVLLDLENFAGDWDLCFHCKLEVMDNVFRRAQRIWDELPRTFGVTQAQKDTST